MGRASAESNAPSTLDGSTAPGPPSRAARGLCCALALAGLGAAPAGAAPARVEVAPPNAPLPALAQPPWPQLAAVFPGVLVHGSGTLLQGRTLTTQRLLLLEGASLLAILVGGLVIYETGAARDLAGPAVLTVAAGVGAFSSSLLANVYAAWSPPEGLGEPRRRLPPLVSGIGYTYVGSPQFDDHHFMTAHVDGRLEGWHLGVDATISPSPGHELLSARGGYRLVGPRAAREPARDGTYLEPQIGFSSERLDRYGFVTRTLEVQVDGRLDADRWLPDVRGAFFQGAVGLARQWIEFDVPGANAMDTSELLILHSGFGVYLGARSAPGLEHGAALPGGELELYYDHRRDGLAGGIQTLGPSSGFAGHVGLRGEYYANEAWGLRLLIERGSAWVLGSSVLFRTGLP